MKVVRRSVDTDGEPLALRTWAGDGAVRLVAALPSDGLLLLERLDPDVDLAQHRRRRRLRGDRRAAAPAARAGPAGPAHPERLVRRLAARGRRPRRAPAPLSSHAATGCTASSSPTPTCDATLVHGDLHYENVLAGAREPWLAIDPQPRAGHPGWDLHAVLRNRRDELGTGAALRWSARHRTEVLCDAAGMDEQAARHWTIVRCLIECVWALDDANADEVSFNIALAKALDD